MKLGIKKSCLVTLQFCIICAMYSIFLLDRSTIRRLAAEDGVIETLGAIGFLVSSVGFGVAYLRSSRSRQDVKVPVGQTRKNIFYLLLSLMFLFGFLEEISWGQRIFHIETPDMIAERNLQREMNIHNLEWFEGNDRSGNRKSFLALLHNPDRLFSIFWFGFCVCVPLLGKLSQRMKKVFAKIRLPVVPVQYAFLFPLTYVASRALNTISLYHYDHRDVVETKEAVFAILFACVALGQVYRLSKSPKLSNSYES